MFCAKCGAKLPDNAIYCPNCGTENKLTNTVAPNAPPRSGGKKQLIVIIIIAAVLVIVGVTTAIILFNSNGNSSDGNTPVVSSSSTSGSSDTTSSSSDTISSSSATTSSSNAATSSSNAATSSSNAATSSSNAATSSSNALTSGSVGTTPKPSFSEPTTSLPDNISINDNGEVTIPDFIGRKWEDVSKEYANTSVLVLTARLEWSDKPVGEIFKQEFPEGRLVMQGSTITLYVSRGIQQCEIEDMSGRTVEAAKKQLEKNGFKVNTRGQEHDTIAKDRVISTIPEAHTMAPVGSTVILIVSSGPSEKPVVMPNFVDMNINDALERCAELNLEPKIELRSDIKEEGTVLEQSIAPETMAYKGDEITLVVSAGESPEIEKEVTVPLPETAKGEFGFKFYVDGELDDDATMIVDIELLASKSLIYTIKGMDGDEKTLAIRAMSTVTGKEDVYYTAKITFEKGYATLSDETRNGGIFEELLNG